MNAKLMLQALSAQDLAARLKAAADPLRLEIIRVLAKDSYGVLELCHIFDMKQSGMSHHLKVLANAGLVTTRREGNSVFYRRTTVQHQQPATDLLRALQSAVNELPLSAVQQARIDEIHTTRCQAAKDFFADISSQFREKQDLIATFEVYGPQVAERINALTTQTQTALEIGPGEGEFLQQLAKRYQTVTALDITPAMLEKAQANNEQHGNIDYVCSNTQWCRQHPAAFDCIVINMVLHHTPSPQQIFADASYALKPGGVLVVCDLCRHEQDWVKEACGDLWHGFEPEELHQWAQDNQLDENQSEYFALRNGFQIQIQLFTKP